MFGLYDFTVSESGKQYLKFIFQSPTTEVSELHQRHLDVQFLSDIVAREGQSFTKET